MFIHRSWLWLIGLVLAGATVYYLSDIVTYLLLAWVLSLLGKPLCSFFQKRLRIGRFKIGAGVAAMLTILCFYGAITGLLLAFVPTLIHQTQQLANVDYQAVGAKLHEPLAHFDTQLHYLGILKKNETLAGRTEALATTYFKPTLLADFVSSFLGIAGNVAVTMTAITFILFFFLKDSDLFVEIIHAIVPDDMETKVRRAADESSEMLRRYFGGLLVQVAAFTFTVTVILMLLGVQNALLLGIFGGILNVIPYIGPIIGMMFGILMTLSSNLDMDYALMLPLLVKVAIAFSCTQFLDNNFVGPMIFSKSVHAHPLEIFIVTLIAAKVGGVVGMVVGIPIYTLLRVVARVFFSEFKVVQRLTEHL